MKWFWFTLLVFTIFLSGCGWIGPKEFNPESPQPLSIEKQEKYNINLSKLKKPESLNPKFVNKNFEEVLPENATYVLFNPKEFDKVRVIVKLAKTYKEVVEKQEELINTKIRIINKYQEQLELEREKAIEYRDLWVNTENLRREEDWNNTLQDYLDKAGIAALIAAIVIISL